MANTKTAKENIKISKRNHDRNQDAKSKVKTALKAANTAISEKAENREEVVKTTLRIIDKTVSKGIIHKKAAARRKSSIAKKLNESK